MPSAAERRAGGGRQAHLMAGPILQISISNGGTDTISPPCLAVLWRITLNHLVHHRGQLTVYLRELGVPLPSLYGPTADER
jgi:hypothetical protein